MKRPLAYFSVVFVSVLFLLQIWNETLLRESPVTNLPDGEKTLSGYVQDDSLRICGTVKDYSYNDQYEQITTELILKDVQILPQNEDHSKEKSNLKSNSDNNPNQLQQLNKNGQITVSGQTIIAYVEGKQQITIGSRLILTGKLSFWKEATNPGEFDAGKYYGNRDVLFSIKKAKILQVGISQNRILRENELFSRILHNLKEFRMKQENYFSEYLPFGNAAIMKAMLFGNKREMEEEIKTLYQNNGIAHILAISGLHISLLGMSVYKLLQYLPLPRYVILFGSEIFLLLYGCMVGFSASSFRAIFMFTLFLLSKVLKRSYDMVTAMAASAVIQLLVHPGYLFDCGFQLSYGAILGIGILLPVLEEINDAVKNKWIRKITAQFLPSLSVTLMTAPILIYHYYELSFFSILLNLIVLPLMSPLLLSGIGLLIAANLVERIGIMLVNQRVLMAVVPSWLLESVCLLFTKLMTFLVNTILWIFETGCRILELFPIGRKNIAPLPIWGIFLYYGLLLAMTILVKKKCHPYQFIFTLLAFCLLLFPQKIDFSVWALDVGQGDCNVIFTEEGNCFVIDCGSTSKYNVGKKILIPFLKYHGIGRVDGVIVTHPDADHMNGVLELMELGEEENLEIDGVYIYEKGLENEYEAWEELMLLADEQEIPVYGIGQGDILQTDSMRMECIYPLDEQSGLTGNSASLVMKVESGEFQGLFAGDLETDGEKRLMEEYGGAKLFAESEENGLDNVWGEKADSTKLKNEAYDKTSVLSGESSCDLLKVGHHGSSGSSSAEFLKWVNPDCAVISCGKDNVYGHPHEETLERLEEEGIPYLITFEEGAICFVDDG